MTYSVTAKKKSCSQEEDLLRRTRDDIYTMPPEEVAELVHALQMHQIELSMQNDELRQTQEALEASHQKYYDLYDFAPVGYITLDKEGVIFESNVMAGTLLGCARSELRGKKFSSFVAPQNQDVYYLHHRKAFRHTTQQSCELTLVNDEGTKDVQLHSLAFAGNEDRCRTTITDITAIKQQEKELKNTRDQAQAASNAKSEFLANMSHEMRTPLNAVMGLAHILIKSAPLTPAQKEYIQTLQLSADSLLTLINELLDIAKIESSTLELEHVPFNLPAIVNETAHIMEVRAKEKALELVTECDPALHPTYCGDPARIRQIVFNLLGNAIKFTEKGKVTLRLAGTPMNDNRVLITLEVMDTGIGIPKQKHGSIFEAFTQADASTSRKFGGTGLGLTICKLLAEHMGGNISVKSAEGEGSTFTVKLPLEKSDKAPQDIPLAPANENTLSAITPHILLVEDHSANRLIATTYLENFHCSCDTATTGKEAIEKIKKNRYSLVLMDIQMPDMDGYETTRRIRALQKEKRVPHTPIIAITAHALIDDRQKCLAAGMDDYISKPFKLEDLKSKLEQYLNLDLS